MIKHDRFLVFWNDLKKAPVSEKGFTAVFTFFLCPFLLILLRAILVRFGLTSLTDVIVNAIWFIAIISSLSLFRKSIKLYDVLFVLILVGTYFISGNLHPETKVLLNEAKEVFLYTCVPLYLVGVTLSYDRFSNTIYWTSVLAIILNIFFFFAISTGMSQGEVSDDNMSMAYSILLPVLVVLLYTFENGNLLDAIFSLLGSLYLLSLGTRGPVLCLLVFICGYFVIFRRFNHNFIVKSLITGMGAICYAFVDVICMAMIGFSSALGLSTRVFESILTNSFANYQESNARDTIAETMIEYIQKDKTGFGYGLMGDRTLSQYGEYSHNLELEMLVSFGKIGGTILLVLLFYYIIKSFIKTKGNSTCLILFVLFCSSIIQLQFSNSFLSCQWFYLYIGFMVASLRIPSNKTSYA